MVLIWDCGEKSIDGTPESQVIGRTSNLGHIRSHVQKADEIELPRYGG